MYDTRIIHWPPGEPQPGDTHREYGRTWIYIPLPEGSPEPGCWKSIGGSGGSGGGGGGGGTVWWSEIYGKPDTFPPSDHKHLDTDILVDTDEDGDYSDAEDLHEVLKRFRDQFDAFMDQLVFGGAFDPDTGKFLQLSQRAIASGFAEGESIPSSPTKDQDKLFFISNGLGNFLGTEFSTGDWLVSVYDEVQDTAEWVPVTYGGSSIVLWDNIVNKPDTIVYDDIAYKPDLAGKPLCRYIDQNGIGKWIEGGSGGGGDGGVPGYHEHGFDEIKDGDGNDLNDVIANLEQDIAQLQGDITFAGSYLAKQSRIDKASKQGELAGFRDGGPLPDPDAQNKSYYLIVIDDGGVVDGEVLSRGDWLISDGITWVVLNYVSNDFDIPILPGVTDGDVLRWDASSDVWLPTENFTISENGDVDSGGIQASGNIQIEGSSGKFIGDGSGLYNLPGMEGSDPPVVSVNGKEGAVVLTYTDVGAAASNHNHSGVYQPVGNYLTSESDPTVPAHVKSITSTNISNWNSAHGWGDHSKAGYAKAGDIPNVSYPVTSVNNKTGAVNLTYTDVGAQVAGSYAASNHTHSNYASSTHTHSEYEPKFTKNTGFNKAFGTTAGTVAQGNHTHSGYAASNHSHSEYAAKDHTHNYAPNYGAGNGISLAANYIAMTGSYTGTFTASGDIVAYSDERLKKNIVTAPCDVIDQLRGVEFEWKEDGRFGSGVIAQEVEQVLPHLVHDDNGNKGVNYMGLVGYLIEEVKALKKEVEALRGSAK